MSTMVWMLVAHARLDHVHRRPLSQQQRRVGVPQVVEPYPLEPMASDQPPEGLAQAVGRHIGPAGVGAHLCVGPGLHALPVLPEQRSRHPGNGDDAPATVILVRGT